MYKRLIGALLLTLTAGTSLQAMEWLKQKAAEAAEYVQRKEQEKVLHREPVTEISQRESEARKTIDKYAVKLNAPGRPKNYFDTIQELKNINEDLNKLYDEQLDLEILPSEDLTPIYDYRNWLELHVTYKPKKSRFLGTFEFEKKVKSGYDYFSKISTNDFASIDLNKKIEELQDLIDDIEFSSEQKFGTVFPNLNADDRSNVIKVLNNKLTAMKAFQQLKIEKESERVELLRKKEEADQLKKAQEERLKAELQRKKEEAAAEARRIEASEAALREKVKQQRELAKQNLERESYFGEKETEFEAEEPEPQQGWFSSWFKR